MLPRSAGNNVKIERGNGEILQILLPHSASNSVKVNRDRELLVQLPANFLYQNCFCIHPFFTFIVCVCVCNIRQNHTELHVISKF